MRGPHDVGMRVEVPRAKQMSVGDPQDIAVHEAMPGHYVQLWHADACPSVLCAVLSSGSFVEGWAVYAEGMMADEGFLGNDPLYRLVQLKVLLRTITNSILDQVLHVNDISTTRCT